MRLGVVAVAVVAGVAVLAGGLWTSRTFLEETAPPTRLAAETLSPTSVELSWASSDEDVDQYVVHVGTDRSLTKDALRVTSRSRQVTLEDLPASTRGADRFFRVDAVKDGEVVRSRTGRFVLPPAAMSELDVDKTGTTGVRLAWEPVLNARQYDVQVATDEAFSEPVRAMRTVGSRPELVTAALDPDRAYWFRARPVSGDLVGEWGEAVSTTTLPEEVRFSVGTWNVCSEKCKGYEGRARQMAAFLNAEKLDLFVLQEAGGERVGPTTNAIFSGGERGFQRATGGAKARYIFYRPALFTQESGGFFPVGDGRHATWARFTVKETGRQFFVVDVHLENGRGNDGKRRSEMNTLVSRMRTINDGGLPIVYAGDFNSGRHRVADSPGAIMRSVGMVDTVDVAEKVENREFNTAHTFSTRPLRSGAHVDHIFASKEFQVLGWKQLVRMSGSSYASPVLTDHNALRATLSLEGKKVDVGAPTPVLDLAPDGGPAPAG